MLDKSQLLPARSFTEKTVARFYPEDDEDTGISFRLSKLQAVKFSSACLTIWSGQSGHGKSLLLNQLSLDIMDAGQLCAIASFEMSSHRTMQRMVRQATGQYLPEVDDIVECMKWLGQRLWIFDHLGTMSADKLLDAFTKGIEEHGISHLIIDSLLKLGLGEDDYSGQKRMVDLLQNYAQKKGPHIHLVAHSRKLSGDDDRPGKMDVRGSASLTDLADNVLSVWRNRTKEESRDNPGKTSSCKYDAILNVAKHRDLGGEVEGTYGLYFHPASMQFTEDSCSKPYSYWEARP